MTAKTLVQALVEIYGRIGDFHITPCDGAIPVSEANRLAEKAVEDYTNAIRSEERAKVVALLREMAINFPEGKEHRLSAIAITCAADGIERGDHLGTSK
jgi:hypothetical protein